MLAEATQISFASWLLEASVASPVDLTQINIGKLILTRLESEQCYQTIFNGEKGGDLTCLALERYWRLLVLLYVCDTGPAIVSFLNGTGLY